MKKRFRFFPFLIPFFLILLLVSCGEKALIISDEYWEGFSEAGGQSPDWKNIVKKGGFRPEVVVRPDEIENWDTLLGDVQPEFILWGPLWVEESYEFAAEYPEIPSLLLFPPKNGEEIPGNITHLSPLRLEAYTEIGELLAEEAGPDGLVLSAFYTGNPRRKAEYEAFEKGIAAGECEYRTVSFRRQENYQNVLDFFNRQEDENVSFLFIAGGAKTAVLRESALKKVRGRILIDIPDLIHAVPEENPSVMFFQWEEILLSVLDRAPGTWDREYDVPISVKLDYR